MRYLATSICLVLSVLVTGSAWADEDSANNEGRGDRRAEMRQKIMDEFDADGNGELSDDERAKAREQMRSRRGNRGGEGAAGKPKRERGGDRAQRGGPGAFPDPAALFDKFDADGSGSLNRAEFKKLAEEMRPPRPPRGPGGGDARPDGPPQEGRRRFNRTEPLQNPEDGEGPRRRPEGRRRPNDEDSQAARGPKGRGNRGAGARGPGGPPDSNGIFDRFDENQDGELSKAEFMKLADRMRQMHEGRGGRGQGGDRRMRDGRGPRRGGPGGEDGPQRRRRPARPDFDNDASITLIQNHFA